MIFLLLFGSEYSFSQVLDSVIFLDEIPITQSIVSRVVAVRPDNDNGVYLSFVKGNKFHLYHYVHSWNEMTKSIFKLDKNYSKGNIPHDFVLSDEFVYVLFDRRISCLSKKKMKEVSSFNPGNAGYVFLSGNHLITGLYYNYHPLDNVPKAGLRKFDLNGNLIDSIDLKVPFPEYTHYNPQKLISFNGEKFIFPLFNGLNFIVVDSNFITVDTVSLSVDKYDSMWVLPSKALSVSVARNMDDLSLYWGFMDDANFRKIARTEYVEFVDSNNLLIRWYSRDTTKGTSNRYTLNLINTNNTWQPNSSAAHLETPIPFDTSKKLFSGGMPLFSHSHLIAYTRDFMYQVKIDIPYIEDLSYRTYFNKKKEMEKVLDPVISLFIFKYE